MADKDGIGIRIWRQSRQELVAALRFFDLALASFAFEESAGTLSYGTDSVKIFYRYDTVSAQYLADPALVNRAFLHMLMHCLYRHPFRRGRRDEDRWNLACDIAVEAVIDSLIPDTGTQGRRHLRDGGTGGGSRVGLLGAPAGGMRRELYRRLKERMDVITAEGVYRELPKMGFPERTLERLAAEFAVDDHQYWKQKSRQQAAENEKRWDDISQRTETHMQTYAREQSDQAGSLRAAVSVANRVHFPYEEFLRRFAVWREEVQLDPESFDPIFYTFGLSAYGNMPLVEPLETSEVRRIESFVIAIDTSGSTEGDLVKAFLAETWGILSERSSFSRAVEVRILQCDTQVRDDVRIRSTEELQAYMENFQLVGGGGTDFRPVFRYTDELVAKGALGNLRGLLYFTDGKGTFPERPPAYETAFLFFNEVPQEVTIPPWAMHLVLEEEELRTAVPDKEAAADMDEMPEEREILWT